MDDKKLNEIKELLEKITQETWVSLSDRIQQKPWPIWRVGNEM